MKIAHFCPFAPHRCGMYETVADIIRAERKLGHQAELIDIGLTGEGNRIGQEDRGVKAHGYARATDADIFVVSGGVEERFLRTTKQPLVHIFHGRPRSSFLADLREGDVPGPYDLMVKRMAQPRWKLGITLWAKHLPYHALVLPPGKLRATSAPPLDLSQFSPEGIRHEFAGPGLHILVADAWRDDWDPYEVLHALAALPASLPFQIHVYAARDINPTSTWQHVFRALKRLGRLGEVKGVMFGFDEVLRGADLVVSGHAIATRVVREACAVGTPVVSQLGCQGALWQYLPTHEDMKEEIEEAVFAVGRDPMRYRAAAQEASLAFDSIGIARELVGFYREALGAEAAAKAPEPPQAREETTSRCDGRGHGKCSGSCRIGA